MSKAPWEAVENMTESKVDGGLRAWRWRLQLGLLANTSTGGGRRAGSSSFFTADEDYVKVLSEQIAHYKKDKSKFLPNVSNFTVDPLMGQDQWSSYYKDLDLIKFIQGDLDRLYVDGVDDDFFQDSARKEMILNILFVWAVQHKEAGAYRQGMHELVAFILFVMESELAYVRGDDGGDKCGPEEEAQNSSNSSSSGNDVSDDIASRTLGPKARAKLLESVEDTDILEAYTFTVFDKLMIQGEVTKLYDPAYSDFIVGYCASIQGAKLRDVDPALVDALELNEIDANLYGMRWVRLLFGREFTFQQTLILWDHIFTSFSPRSCSSFLDVLGNVMMAMLLRLRNVLIRGDMNECLAVLMRYPPLAESDFRETILRVVRQLHDNSYTLTSADNGISDADGDSSYPHSETSRERPIGIGAPSDHVTPAFPRLHKLAQNLPKLPQMPKIERPKWMSNSPWQSDTDGRREGKESVALATQQKIDYVTERLDALASEAAELGPPRALETRLRCLASILTDTSTVEEYDAL